MTDVLGSGLFFFAVLLVGLTVLLLVWNIRRTLSKDNLVREEMTVYFPPPPKDAPGSAPLASELTERLARLGYTLLAERIKVLPG